MGSFFGMYLVMRSRIVPRGHNQPQKNLPRIMVNTATRAPGKSNKVNVFWERR